MLVILLLGGVLAVFAGSHVDARTGLTVNNFLNSYTLIQTATDASFFAIMAVGATIVIISGGIDLSVGSIYALAGVTTAMVLRSVGPLDPLDDDRARADGLARHRPRLRRHQRRAGRRPRRAPVHHHARDDVDRARHCVRGEQRREHSPAARADERRQGVARPGRRALSGADARHAGRGRRRRHLPDAHRRRAARLRRRRQRRGEPVFGRAHRPREDRGVRALRADGGPGGVHGRELLRLGVVRGRDRLRALRHCLGRRRRREPVGRQGQRRERAARRAADRAHPAVDPHAALRSELRVDHHRLRDYHRRRARSGERALHGQTVWRANRPDLSPQRYRSYANENSVQTAAASADCRGARLLAPACGGSQPRAARTRRRPSRASRSR